MSQGWRADFVCAATVCVWGSVLTSGASAGVLALEPSETATVQNSEVPTERRVLLRFDIPEHLSQGIVEIATLELHMAADAPDSSAGVTLDCFLVTAPWAAGSVDWAEGWSAPGGDFDRGRHAMSSLAVGDSSLVQFDVTGIVGAWASLDMDNHGFIVARAPGEEAVLQRTRGTAGGNTPPSRLTIWYTPFRDE